MDEIRMPDDKQAHFVLVHGACHGAWSWYKLKPLLEAAGHRVTLLDLAAAGIDKKAIHDIHTFSAYTQPLLDFLASLKPNEKVILVGHSLGGLSVALAVDGFPEKISCAVFLAAFMPDTTHKPSFVLDQYWERTPAEDWLDTEFAPYSSSQQHMTTMFFGPKFLAKLYRLSSTEDLELAKTLVRPASLFLHDLSTSNNYSYGSVPRVYIICNEDEAIPQEFQRWMIENSPVQDVMEIEGADHMPMLCKPREACTCLSKIAQKYDRKKKKMHFVLVHCACGGAWTWYKVKPRLEAAGHRVTALDMAASGLNKKSMENVRTFCEYSEPLLEFMASLEENEKVILVGHSLGGLNLALAMDKFPHKVSVAVFVTAFLPDTIHQPSYFLEKYCEKYPPENQWIDTKILVHGSTEEPHATVVLGPEFVASMAYQLSPIEDIELAKMLFRPGSLFLGDLSKAERFSEEGYGSVNRAYVVCTKDIVIPPEFQHWMIECSGAKDVREIETDHMVVASKPQELCEYLLEIAQRYGH
ncbi:hypothetical protein Tsubulata_031185 [Turnera subulata]|uniref:(S)-hydroxynitrile lyase n=1 Tax=Turnera subulata TaxID=218843 RepID=A0A9Q0F9K3_9ROSI|nr:hypothetical protein Tsubulata_031185 [Turnera subulata]